MTVVVGGGGAADAATGVCIVMVIVASAVAPVASAIDMVILMKLRICHIPHEDVDCLYNNDINCFQCNYILTLQRFSIATGDMSKKLKQCSIPIGC